MGTENFGNQKKYMNPDDMKIFWNTNKKKIIDWLSNNDLKKEKKDLYIKELEELENEFEKKYSEYKKNYDEQILKAERLKDLPEVYKMEVESINQDFEMLIGIYKRRIEDLKLKITSNH